MDYGEYMLRLENIKIREELNNEEALKRACKKNHIELKDVLSFYVFKKSIDARNKEDIFYNYTIDVEVKDEKKYGKIKIVEKNEIDLKLHVKRRSNKRPVIVGAGPAGLFCGLILSEYGLNPIIVEQGKKLKIGKKM